MDVVPALTSTWNLSCHRWKINQLMWLMTVVGPGRIHFATDTKSKEKEQKKATTQLLPKHEYVTCNLKQTKPECENVFGELVIRVVVHPYRLLESHHIVRNHEYLCNCSGQSELGVHRFACTMGYNVFIQMSTKRAKHALSYTSLTIKVRQKGVRAFFVLAWTKITKHEH